MNTFMRRFYGIVASYFLAANFFLAVAADTNPPPRLTVELLDGSRVVGTSVEKNFRFHSLLLGDLKLAVKDIRLIECVSTNAAKLSTTSGDALTVSFVDSELAVKTSFGKVDLLVKSVRNLTVSAGGRTGGHPPGLVALWSGDGNSLDSVGGNHAELHGGTSFAPGKFGQAFAFHNIGDVVTAPTSNFPVGSEDRTIAGWIYVESFIPDAEAVIAAYGKFGKGGQVFGVYFNTLPDHRLCWSAWGGALTGPALDADHWHYITVTSSSHQTTIYVDGVNVASEPMDFDTPSGTSFRIGQIAEPDCLRQFIGLIDEVAVYNRALSADEIRKNYEAGGLN